MKSTTVAPITSFLLIQVKFLPTSFLI